MPDVVGQVLDRQLALSRVGGDVELFKELAELFIEEYPRVLQALRSALASGDALGMERAAHGLKGSVATLGGISVAEIARQVEMLGREQKLTDAGHAIRSLELALMALRTELDSL